MKFIYHIFNRDLKKRKDDNEFEYILIKYANAIAMSERKKS